MPRLKVYDLATETWGYAGGVNSTALAADPAFISMFVSIANDIGRRNLLDNGEFLINQLYAIGGSFISMNNPTSDVYFSDRWMMVNTVANMSVYPGLPPPRFEDFVVMVLAQSEAALTPTGTNAASIKQYIEGRNLQHLEWGTVRAKPVTLSLVSSMTSSAAGVPGGTIIAELQAGTRCISRAINVTASLARYSVTFPGDTVGTIANDNLSGLKLRFWLSAGDGYSGGSVLNTDWSVPTTNTRAKGITNLFWASGNQFRLTGVQLEAGSIATPFEHIAYGPSLQECQRYFQLFGRFGANDLYGTGYGISSTSAKILIPFTVPMRALPTVILTGNNRLVSGAGTYVVTSVLVPGSLTPQVGTLDISVASGLTIGTGYMFGSNGDITASTQFLANLA